MNFLFISKFPPIQGGVSAQSYWTVKYLLEKGHTVYVLTNAAEIEANFKIFDVESLYEDLKDKYGDRIHIHNTLNLEHEFHIPYSIFQSL